MFNDNNKMVLKEVSVLRKYYGEGEVPENEFERVHIEDGKVVRIDKIENGEIVESQIALGGE